MEAHPEGVRRPSGQARTGTNQTLDGDQLRYTFTTIDQAQPVELSEVAFDRVIVRLYSLGPRLVAELLRELGRISMRRTEIEGVVREFCAIPPGALLAAGGGRCSALPLRGVRP